MRFWRLAPAAAAVLALTGAACSQPPASSPVAAMTFAASRPLVAPGSPVDLTYKFDVLSNTAIGGDYTIFVHVLDADGDMLWSDDHNPPIRTSEWTGGQTVGPYTRTRFVPPSVYLGQATVVAGLYHASRNDRLSMTSAVDDGKRAKAREYKVGTLEIVPSTANLQYGRGWFDLDGDPKDPSSRWRWTAGSAVLATRNPGTDGTLYFEADARADIFTPPQTVTILVNGQAVSTFSATNTRRELRRIPVTAAQLGARDTVEIRVDIDRTFNPSQLPVRTLDNRDLGIRVYNVYLEAR